jgi:hypothetical protein
MTQAFDAQDNQNRLQHDFHYAALGARCRTFTFINPNLAELGHYEWLESECADGRTWDIKTMKATVHGDAPDDIQVQQIYLDGAQGLNFGAMVLKLSDYQKAQDALGFLRDESDLGALAGADHFRDVAVKQGIAFNENDEPVAAQNGLIRKSGTYAITAFAAASAIQTAVATVDAAAVVPVDLKLPVMAGPPLTTQERKAMTDCVTTLNRIAEKLEHKLNYNDLLHCNSMMGIPGFSKSSFTIFVSTFDGLMAPILANKEDSPRLAQITQDLQLFTYQVFRMMGRNMTSSFEEGGSHYNDKKTSALIEQARTRCMLALEKVSPGASSAVFDLFAYDPPIDTTGNAGYGGNSVEEQDKQDQKDLRRIIARIQDQLQNATIAPTASAPRVGIQPDAPWPRG